MVTPDASTITLESALYSVDLYCVLLVLYAPVDRAKFMLPVKYKYMVINKFKAVGQNKELYSKHIDWLIILF